MLKNQVKICLVLLVLMSGQVFGQLQSYWPPKTHRQLAGSPSSTFRADSLIFQTYVIIDSVIVAIKNSGLVSSNFGTLSSAIDAAATDTSLVIVPAKFFSIGNDTLPRHVALSVNCGATISVNAGATFTILGHFTAPRCKIFAGSGIVTFGNGSVDDIYPEWWGAKSDSSTASITSLQSAVTNSLNGGTITLPTGTYLIADSLEFDEPTSIDGTVTQRTAGASQSAFPGTSIKAAQGYAGPNIIVTTRGSEIRNLNVVGNSTMTNSDGIKLYLPGGSTTLGDNTLYNNYSANNGRHGYHIIGSDGNTFIQNDAHFNRGYGVVFSAPSGATGANAGIASQVIGGRTRKNSLGGMRIDRNDNMTLIGVECIADTVFGLNITGKGISGGGKTAIGNLLLGCDIEQTKAALTGGPSTNIQLHNVRATTVMNSFIGGTGTNRGVWADSVWEATFINNHFSGIDSEIVVSHFANLLFVGNQLNFTPDSIRTVGGGTLNWAEVRISDDNSGVFDLRSNRTIKVRSTAGDAYLNGTQIAIGSNNTPNHPLSFYAANPRMVFTDTDINKNIASAAQASDTASIDINSGNSPPRITFTGADGDQSYIDISTTDQMRFNGAAGGYVADALTTVEAISISDTVGFVLSASPNNAATVSTISNVILDTNAAVALDTVTTLTGVIGQIIYISNRDSSRDIRFLDAGNFSLAAERTLSDVADVLVLKATSTTVWKEVSFSDNN